jgi:hypothetical protein
VRQVGDGGHRIQVVSPCHLPDVVPSQDAPFDLSIDLARVPVVTAVPFVNPCVQQPRLLDLRDSLADGRLDVLVAGRSRVNFSRLAVLLADPPEVAR